MMTLMFWLWNHYWRNKCINVDTIEAMFIDWLFECEDKTMTDFTN
jgi:hypothetical protein